MRAHKRPRRIVRPASISKPNSKGHNVAYITEVEVLHYRSNDLPCNLLKGKRARVALNEKAEHRVLDKAPTRRPTPCPSKGPM